jgi:capsular exopolysaccharide synthesis family protein
VLLTRWKIAAAIALLVVGATWYSSRRAVKLWQSSAQVQVNSRKQFMPNINDVDVEEIALRTDPVLSEALVLSTQALALTVADTLGLRLQAMDPGVRRGAVLYAARVDPMVPPDSLLLRVSGSRYELRGGDGALLAAGPADSAVVAPGISFLISPALRSGEIEVQLGIIPRIAAADLVRGGLAFSIQPSTNVVSVTYTGTDPSLGPVILDAALRALQNYGADRIREIALQRLHYIEDRVQDARSRYLEGLGRVQAYQEQQATTDLSAEEVALINTIQDFEREKERRRLDLATIRSILGGRDSISLETVNRLAAVAAVSGNPAMAFQLENILRLFDERRTLVTGTMGLRENNPQIVGIDDRIRASARALVDATNATARGLESGIVQMDENIRNQRSRLATFPGKQSRFAQLRLETDLQHDTYRFLLSQFEAARIQAASIAPYVQVIEAATSSVPIGMGGRQKLLIGLMLGAFLGLVAAFFMEYLDQTVKSAADVERVLDVAVLGMIPLEPVRRNQLQPGHRRAIPLVSQLSSDHPASEAYRALRTNVTFVNAEQRDLRLIAVTSPGPGEGKSTTAANLAITLAQQGTATLLVDADLRRPIVHRAFNIVQDPGLTDVLVGTADLREAVRPAVAPMLDVLPAGALPPNPSELLGSEAMRRLLDQLRTRYEAVIFDTPPTLAVTDATVLGANVDGVMMVLRSGDTEDVAAQRALEQLRRVQARIAGVVLNGVAKQHDRYYKYYSYARVDGRPGGGARSIRERLASLI